MEFTTTPEAKMTDTAYSTDLDLAHADWERLDRETQIHIAKYDDGDFRELATFTNQNGSHNGRHACVTWTVCEELIDGRWEGFVALNEIVYR